METPLALAAFATATASSLSARNPSHFARTGLLVALLCYLRPEMVACLPSLLGIPLVGLEGRERPRALLLGLFSFGLPMAALFLARHAYFGEWLPNTYYAKVSGGGLKQRLLGIGYVLHFCAIHPIYVALAAWGLVRGSAPARRVGVVLANFLLAVVWAGGDGFYLARLALPALPLVAVLAAVALLDLRHLPRWNLVVAGAVALQVLIAWRGTSDFKSYVVGPKFAADNAKIGTYIRGLPEGTIAAVGIGAIAYTSERPILDLVGLADKHIARSRRVAGAAIGHDHVDNDYVLARAPRYVIGFAWLTDQPLTTEAELQNLNGDATMWMSAISLLRDPRFLARYSPHTYQLGTQYLRLWQLNDGIASQ